MSAEHRLAEVGYDFWEAQYHHATAAGCGEVVALAEERVAASDELVAASLVVLLRAGCRLTAAAVGGGCVTGGHALTRDAAIVVRLLDRALAAHGRDNGYDVEAWRESAVTCAWTLGDEDEGPDITLFDDIMRLVGEVVVALPRDRLGVPEYLSGAIGRALLAYAVLDDASP
ncbi:hypothetical protein [Solirubrobacter soli]|uniref:hypothetical protein n=1 Tax=Solirubrobacter soli TaxID=363832 RepID=UPI000403E4F7|nr:hypothetical protein [Solirubrobacter soli]